MAVAESLKAILQRIADFFDIFGLSFVMSGAVTWRFSLLELPLNTGASNSIISFVVLKDGRRADR